MKADGSIPMMPKPKQSLRGATCRHNFVRRMDIKNLVKITTIVRNEADIPAVRTGRAAVLGSHKPASTLIVGGLSNAAWKVEVEAIAVA